MIQLCFLYVYSYCYFITVCFTNLLFKITFILERNENDFLGGLIDNEKCELFQETQILLPHLGPWGFDGTSLS